MDAYSDGDLISMWRKGHSRDVAVELWSRADTDIEYRGNGQLSADLERIGVKRPTVERIDGGALTDRYRKRFGA